MADIEVHPAGVGSQSDFGSKTCARCNSLLPASVEHFSPIKARKSLHAWCKPCCAEDRRERRAANPEHHRKILRDCYARNAEAYKARNKARWPADAIKFRDTIKKRQAERKDFYNENRRAKYAASPEARAERNARHKEWMAANRDEVLKRRRDKWKQATPSQRLRSNMGAAIYHAIKGTGKGGKSWQQLVGYSTDNLKRHLERQFSKGMTWENYGEWHVDHIVPASSFSYSSPHEPEFQACWALTNLRPLWGGENVSKGKKILHLI